MRFPLAALAIALVPLVSAADNPDKPSDLDLLQGKWVAVEWELMGKELDETDIVARNYRVEIDKDKFKIHNGESLKEGTFKLRPSDDPDKKPGIRLGNIYAIYEIKGNTLRLCMGTTHFPNDFRTEKGSVVQMQMLTLRRPEDVAPPDAELEKVRDELIALEKKTCVSSNKKGIPFLKTVVPRDAIMVQGDSKLRFGLEYTEDYTDEVTQYEFEGWRAQKLGRDAVLLLYKFRSKGPEDKEFSQRTTTTSIWVRRDGRWMNTFTQFTADAVEAAEPEPKEPKVEPKK